MAQDDRGAPRPRDYVDLTLELRGLDAGSFLVSVSGPEVGESGEVEVEYDKANLEPELAMLESGLVPDDELVELGGMLAELLLPEGEIRDIVASALRATGPDEGVRLRLVIREPELAALPWELAHFSPIGRSGPGDFLVLDPRMSLVRHEPLPVPAAALTPLTPQRLRVLAVFAAEVTGFPALDLDAERQLLNGVARELPSDAAVFDVRPPLEDPTAADLAATAVLGADIFHFAGHGGFADGDGFIALTSATGRADLLPAAKLAKLMRQAGVRVAVLGACQSGARSATSRWAGVAAALVADQVAAVVAMQYPIRNSHATAFVRGFYAALSVGLSLDEAVSAGRLGVYGLSRPGFSWGIPAVYTRSPDGIVFPELAAQHSASADTLRTVVRQVVDGIEQGGRAVGIKQVRVAAGELEVHQQASAVQGEVVGIDTLELGAPAPRRDGGS